jgi:hypothetical protein
MTGVFGIDKTGLQCAIGVSFVPFLAFFLVSFQPGQMKSGKVRNGVEPLLYEYTVIIALIFRDVQSI